jgi:hypothetical protein
MPRSRWSRDTRTVTAEMLRGEPSMMRDSSFSFFIAILIPLTEVIDEKRKPELFLKNYFFLWDLGERGGNSEPLS